jgi:alkylation response protein AidB-like acyl-CoA dehydrogenase
MIAPLPSSTASSAVASRAGGQPVFHCLVAAAAVSQFDPIVVNRRAKTGKAHANRFRRTPLTGLEPLSSRARRAGQRASLRAEVMRPLAATLDRMTPEEVIAPESPLWQVLQQAEGLGLSVLEMAGLPPLERARLFAIATEELAWGDGGLTGALLVNHFPVMYSLLAGNLEMARYCEGKLGCWAITEPDHGSDAARMSKSGTGQAYGQQLLRAHRRRQGRRQRQESTWVSRRDDGAGVRAVLSSCR